jgi:predicted Zn-ribbon and HTH transcriptional regulator
MFHVKHEISSFYTCDQCGCESGIVAGHDHDEAEQVAKNEGWVEYLQAVRTPTGRIKKYGGHRVLMFCSKCKKRCRKHPRYKAVRRPTSHCPVCMSIWHHQPQVEPKA